MTERATVSLADISGRKGDYGLVASARAQGDHKFLRTTDMISGVIDWAAVPSSDAEPRKREKSLLKNGDIVISRTGANAGAVAYVSKPPEGAVFAGYLVRFSVDESRADPRFVYYSLRSPNWREHVESARTGSAQPQLNAVRMGSYKFWLPPLPEQRRIAGVLGALDDLIDTNEQLVNECAALRGALRSKALSSADDVAPLSSFARFVNGRNFTKHANGQGRPIIRTPEVRSGTTQSTPKSDVDAHVDNVAIAGDMLLVWSGSLMVARWLGEEALVNQHIFKAIPSGVPAWLVFGLLEHQLPWFLSLAADKATTMGHIQRAHLDALVPFLTQEQVEKVGRVVEPLWDAELEMKLENAELRRTRDELLPLLMSGKIRVREAEELVKERVG